MILILQTIQLLITLLQISVTIIIILWIIDTLLHRILHHYD